jgi:Xaa-Pro aminopeptidase
VRVARLERLRGELDRAAVGTLLVTSPPNVRYLTGFESSNAALLAGPEAARLVTDGRYIEAARGLQGLEVVQSSRDLTTFLGERLHELADGSVGFEAAHVTYAGWQALSASDVELVPTTGLVEALRAVKEPGELEAIRAAAGVTNAVYERLAEEGGVVGLTEAQLARRLALLLDDAGADGLAFPTIAASGPNAALPHHHPGERRIEAGETLIVDLGAALGGYASDCTRTFATGELPDDLARAYEACREAQAEALAAVRPGASAREVDGIARRRLEAEGYETLHGLGHGLGIEVHEAPRLADTSDATLEAGNVVTVEPGVYLAGRGGIRIEDLVIVARDGPEVLTTFTKELVTLR